MLLWKTRNLLVHYVLQKSLKNDHIHQNECGQKDVKRTAVYPRPELLRNMLL